MLTFWLFCSHLVANKHSNGDGYVDIGTIKEMDEDEDDSPLKMQIQKDRAKSSHFIRRKPNQRRLDARRYHMKGDGKIGMGLMMIA